jgi:threonine/homoserine/homoserine lactone efflux protein
LASVDQLVAFFVATAIFACIPGPGMLYAAAQTIARGQRAGWLSAAGLHLGGYVHIALAACGLAAVLAAVPVLFSLVKLAGAGYLIWLGARMFVARAPIAAPLAGLGAAPCRRAVLDSVIVEMLNPKTALFYLAFLPQFTDTAGAVPVWGQVLVLGAVVNVMFSLTDAACVLLAEILSSRMAASRRAGRIARRIGGGILVGLGINLAVARQ